MENQWDYKVALKQIETVERKDEIVNNRLATVDETTGNVIGLVGNRYKLIQNKTIHDTMQELSEGLDLELQQVQVMKGRKVTSFRYGFKKAQATVDNSLTADDKVNFGIEIINAFDMGLLRMVRAFAHRLVCKNGLTIPRECGRFSLQGLDGFSQDTVRTKLESRIAPILATANTWKEWAKIEPDRIKVSDLINGNLPQKAAEQILSEYGQGKDKTVWGLYNQVTYYISHVAKTRDLENLRCRQWELENLANKFYTVDLK